MALLRWTRRLDPRERAQPPIEGAVNIPFSELPKRTYELPSKDDLIEVVGEGPEMSLAAEWLLGHGRKAEISSNYSLTNQTESLRLWQPNAFLAEVVSEGSGQALDLGCGTGRDAVYLASLGWQVTAVDHLKDAIERARDLERRYLPEPSIRWSVEDLEGWPLESPGPFDLITMFYFLDRAALGEAVNRLAPGGRLILETFTTVHRKKFGKPQSDRLALAPGEAPELVAPLEIEVYEEGWHGQRHTARVLARKPF